MMIATSPSTEIEAVMKRIKPAHKGWEFRVAGTNGGYALARPASKISAFEVIRAIDGPLFITSCITIHGSCDLAGHCTIKEPLRKVNDSITDLLSNIHISDLIETADDTRGDEAVAPGRKLVSILQ